MRERPGATQKKVVTAIEPGFFIRRGSLHAHQRFRLYRVKFSLFFVPFRGLSIRRPVILFIHIVHHGGTMNARTILTALGIILLACMGCNGGSSSNSDSDFKNSLTLGTGMSGFVITGETTTFMNNDIIYWRLESEADMGGSSVEIVITKDGAQVGSVTFPSPQSYGHIMLSGFKHTYGTGNFRATGKLVTGNKTVAYKDYTVK